jgi:hypothetical protein
MISACQFLELLILPPRDSGWKPPTVQRIDHPGKIIGVPSHCLETTERRNPEPFHIFQ